MTQDNDYNIIKPVENLQNIGAMTPVDRQSPKRRRQNQKERRGASAGPQEQPGESQDQTRWPDNSQAGQNSIDYRA